MSVRGFIDHRLEARQRTIATALVRDFARLGLTLGDAKRVRWARLCLRIEKMELAPVLTLAAAIYLTITHPGVITW